jgi:hypothetical protein
MKKGLPWASPSFDACTSWIFHGVTWASPSLSFCPSFISSHHSPFPTLENFLYTKLHTILISNISLCKIVDPLLVQFLLNYNIKILATVENSSKSSSDQKNSKRKRSRGKCQ